MLYLGRDGGPPGYELVAHGKVRDIYAIDARHFLFVTTDRISAFDVVMSEGIPHKGAVLTTISTYWFEHTRDIVANHLVSTSVEDLPGLDAAWRAKLAGRIMIVRKAAPTDVEWVVRGYLAGSGWKDYQRTGEVSGVRLPEGLQHASRLPEPILTPSTKEAVHDVPITHAQARERVGESVFQRASLAATTLFARGASELERHGILLADTKFEFGLLDGRLILIDEVLTPDSSRFWPSESWRSGTNPPSLDKQVLRDWLEGQSWNKSPPPPPVDPRIVERISTRYLEICQRITGKLPTSIG